MGARLLDCEDCPRSFREKNELEYHKLTHLPATIRCLCCTRLFTTFYGMVIHLESGTCGSGQNLGSLNKIAAQCFQWKKYLVKEYRDELYAGNTEYRKEGARPFKCPRCEDSFPLLSSLFQHVWSPACGQGKNGVVIKKLIRWMSKKTYLFRGS